MSLIEVCAGRRSPIVLFAGLQKSRFLNDGPIDGEKDKELFVPGPAAGRIGNRDFIILCLEKQHFLKQYFPFFSRQIGRKIFDGF